MLFLAPEENGVEAFLIGEVGERKGEVVRRGDRSAKNVAFSMDVRLRQGVGWGRYPY